MTEEKKSEMSSKEAALVLIFLYGLVLAACLSSVNSLLGIWVSAHTIAGW